MINLESYKKVKIDICEDFYKNEVRELINRFKLFAKFDVDLKFFLEQIIMYPVDLPNLWYKSIFIIKNKEDFEKEVVDSAFRFFEMFENKNGVFSPRTFISFYLYFVVKVYFFLKEDFLKSGKNFERFIVNSINIYKNFDLVGRSDKYIFFENFMTIIFILAFGEKFYKLLFNVFSLGNDDIRNIIDGSAKCVINNYVRYGLIDVKNGRDFERMRLRKFYKQAFGFDNVEFEVEDVKINAEFKIKKKN